MSIKTSPRNLREIMRDEMVMQDRILEFFAKGPATIPALAEQLGTPLQETVYWVMAMRRYGLISETGRPDEDGYFSYIRVEKESEEQDG